MSKLLKQIRHGVYLLSDSAQDCIGFKKHRKVYFQPTESLKLPKNQRESMARDMEKIGSDMYSAINKFHAE